MTKEEALKSAQASINGIEGEEITGLIFALNTGEEAGPEGSISVRVNCSGYASRLSLWEIASVLGRKNFAYISESILKHMPY